MSKFFVKSDNPFWCTLQICPTKVGSPVVWSVRTVPVNDTVLVGVVPDVILLESPDKSTTELFGTVVLVLWSFQDSHLSYSYEVRTEGLEPSWIAPREFKSPAYTNSAMLACCVMAD